MNRHLLFWYNLFFLSCTSALVLYDVMIYHDLKYFGYSYYNHKLNLSPDNELSITINIDLKLFLYAIILFTSSLGSHIIGFISNKEIFS